MSEEFEKIKNEVNGFLKIAENKIESEKKSVEERIKKEELILEKSGIRQLFEEIRDSGLVKGDKKTVDELEYRKIFPGSYEENLDYHQAHIVLFRLKNNNVYHACLSLEYSSESYIHYAIKIAVIEEDLCLREWPYDGSNEYLLTPIKEGELATTIARALKNPEYVPRD